MNQMMVIHVNVEGLGIVFYSPFAVAHIAEGEDYFTSHYQDAKHVQSHIQAGTIVGFGTGSPGIYRLVILEGYPTEEQINAKELKLRLGIEVRNQTVCVRDLFDLMDWTTDCPEGQSLDLADGYYHITLCGDRPSSGIIGDNQEILAYFSKLERMPALRNDGIPMYYQRA